MGVNSDARVDAWNGRTGEVVMVVVDAGIRARVGNVSSGCGAAYIVQDGWHPHADGQSRKSPYLGSSLGIVRPSFGMHATVNNRSGCGSTATPSEGVLKGFRDI